MNPKPVRLVITKLEAARRQIDTAIALWFDDGDPISINTLAAAGHHICNDLSHNLKIAGEIMFPKTNTLPKPQQKDKRALWMLENFSKHADKPPDNKPDSAINFCPELTEIYLLDATNIFKRIAGESTHLMKAFRLYFYWFNPTLAKPPCVPSKLYPVDLRLITKRQFLESFLESFKGT